MTSYTLLAVTGLSPQVVTETVYALAQEPGRPLPERVVLVTTGTGADFVEAILFDQSRTFRAGPIRPQAAGWAALAEALGADLPHPEIVAPARPGERAPIPDLLSGPDAALVADAVYRLTHDLTAPGQPPLVASIAGGRKTMSADLQAAFSVYARPEDRLVHVLVEPPTYERSDFLFPTADTPDARLTLVEVQVPRLRRVLDGPLLDHLPADRRGLGALLDALAPVNYPERPARAELVLATGARGACTLRLFGTAGTLAELRLPAAEAATLLALADAFARSGGASATDLLAPGVQAQRSTVMQLATFGDATPWADRRAVSTAINRLNTALARVPMAADALGIASERPPRRDAPVAYRWAAPPGLPLAVVYPAFGAASWHDDLGWPFEAIPRPTLP